MVDLQQQLQTPVTDVTLSQTVDERGGLPSDWGVKALAELAEVTAGGSAPQGDEYFTGDKPFVRVQHVDQASDYVTRWDLINAKAVNDYNLKLFPAGTIVLPKSGASIRLEKRGVLTVDSYLVSHLCAILPDESLIDRWFLFYALRANKLAREKADGYPVLNLSEIKAFQVPLPPLPEQRAIAHVLRTVQRAREATERVIAATRELKKSLMRHLFTYGPVPVDQVDKVRLKETEIGLVPEHWRVVKLGGVCEKPQYGYTATASPNPVGPRFLRITDIQDERVNWEAVPYCALPAEELGSYQLIPGDIVVARIGATTGKSYLLKDCPTAVFASYLIRIRTKSLVNPAFLGAWMKTDSYWGQINSSKGGRLKLGVNAPVLKALQMPLPPLDEQAEIARLLERADRKVEIEETRKQALESTFKTLLHHLMTGKVRVQLPNFREIHRSERHGKDNR